MILFTPEWFVYPLIFMMGVVIAYILSRGTTSTFFLLLFIWIAMYSGIYLMLSFATNKGWIPCFILIGNYVGGCVV